MKMVSRWACMSTLGEASNTQVDKESLITKKTTGRLFRLESVDFEDEMWKELIPP